MRLCLSLCFPSLLVAAALTLGSAVGPTAAGIAAAADGDAFYATPAPLPVGPPGAVIRATALDAARTMALPGAARTQLVLYRSVDPSGAPVAVSGTVSVPPGAPPAGGWPVIVWTHGTTGIAPPCGPSLDDANGPEHPYIVEISTLLQTFIKDGYAVVATDYQGLGAGTFHPFLQGVPNGQNALDMLRAARAVEPSIGTRFGVVGHSQGGQADMFTAAIAATYAPEFTLVGNIAFAPGSRIADRLAAVMASDKVELSLPYTVYVLQSYATTFPEIPLDRILTAQARAHLPDLMVGCMTHALTEGYWSTAIAKDQFVAQPDLGAFLKVAALNEIGALHLAQPTLVLQGLGDVTVPPAYTDASVAAMCQGGNGVDYHTYPGVSHGGVMVSGAADARRWMAARFAGAPAANTCPAAK